MGSMSCWSVGVGEGRLAGDRECVRWVWLAGTQRPAHTSEGERTGRQVMDASRAALTRLSAGAELIPGLALARRTIRVVAACCTDDRRRNALEVTGAPDGDHEGRALRRRQHLDPRRHRRVRALDGRGQREAERLAVARRRGAGDGKVLAARGRRGQPRPALEGDAVDGGPVKVNLRQGPPGSRERGSGCRTHTSQPASL